ncbi:MAG: RagB/SusD family nutrient uptake outer membrane protein [Bacteroidetes bacterium]|nr:MAG: RagB/SusD family nutrient uptake outer membrane protein [Bacteroidota bacterium]
MLKARNNHRKMKIIRIIPLFVLMLVLGIACQDEFLDVSPPGSYSAPSLQNAKGVEGMLIATYSALDGSWFENWGNHHFNQSGGASNWVWGAIRSEVAYKGTEESDGVNFNPIERAEVQPGNPVLNDKWDACYDGIGKANATLQNLEKAKDEFSESDYNRVKAEARFLRGHFHFEAVKVFGRAPYVDETVTDFPSVKNSDQIIWADIENDFRFAYETLPGTMPAAGRVNKYAAGAMLAKVMIYQAKWAEAKPILDDVINNGTTSEGVPLALTPKYHDNFRADKEQGNSELMFGYEASFGDGSISNGNYENTLNQPHGSNARTACCGFFQPSQNLANSFKVDDKGLPMPDTYNDSDIVTDEGVPATDPFTPEQGPLDARIDWTLGRRGIPFLDWGINPGSTGGWVRNVPNGGPYNPVKTVPTLAEFDAQLAGVINWGFTSSAKNVHIIRFADVLLFAAEVEAELNNLAAATNYVNMVRERAANQDGWVKFEDGTPAANYNVGLYPVFASQADALKAIRFERKLELAMEGHRMFDLVRWHRNSAKSALPFDAVAYMNDYFAKEQIKRAHLAGATFEERYLWMPIPVSVITQSTVGGVQNITQNPGYN